MDREAVSLLTVPIKAVQQNNLLKSADSVVLITILDENDNPPNFSQPIYKSYLAENSPTGTNVLVLTASDKDEDGLSNGYFTTNNTMFKVDKMGAMYLTHGELDRELTPEIAVKVWVFDAETNGLNSSALVIITIIDINDNNPVFHNTPLFFTIPEGFYTIISPLLVGQVNATDADEGLNGEVTITKASEYGDNTFIVQPNGIIIAQGPLDRETKNRYVMSLIASDNGTPPRESFADLVIVIQDVNDNAPTFTQHEYSAHLVLPEVKIGDPFLTVSATDLDTGNSSQISYRFAQPLSIFSINKENGQISLVRNISGGSAGTSIALRVIATDHGVPALSSTTTVFITIAAGNTEFVSSKYSFSVLEDMPEGTEVGTVQAVAGPDIAVMYVIMTYKEIFSITNSGTIITRTMLDREEQDSYSIIVSAVDSRDPPSTAAVVVNINIIDVNDNTPVFSPLIKTNVTCPENMNFLDFGYINATDKDVGNNSAVTYSLQDCFNGTFHINSSTGKLTITKPLDAETADYYDLNVLAKDSGIPPLSSSIIIHVSVQDVDDNPPIFRTNLYNVTVKENEPPHVILSVSAEDMDIGDNAIILYSFTNISHLFYIGEMSGNISILKPLDFETSSQHVLTVIAYSPSDPRNQSTATVTVHVEDVNEEGPTMEYPVYHTVIWDGLYTPGNIILDINATKGNEAMDEGIHYSISGSNSEGLFAIANATGHIFLIKDLAVHNSPLHYVLKVNCTDSRVPPQSTSVKVYVTISPSNISQPVFSADYYSPETLNDWAVPHTYLTQIKAFYLPSSLIYSISTKKDKDCFVVDPVTGIIRTKNVLNVKDFPSNMTVKATDSQKPWIYSEATVHVTVISGNQYAPVFPNPVVNVTVKEEHGIPTFITQVHAMDGDTGRNGDLTYSILNDQPFTINAKDGNVLATITFDFETGPNEFQIFILAEDHGIPQKKQGYCTLVVHVLDINDCKPVFAPLDYIIVEENVPVGTSIGQVTATDGDTDEDGQFEIDELLGNILVKNPLDYETKRSSLLNITATNNKTAPFYQTSTQLTIHLFDDNDNAPQFTQKLYFAELDVNSPVGTLVRVVNATDRDQGDNGVIDYFLLFNSSSEYFLLENEREGRIITGSHLEPGEITITVVAKDRGSPSLNNSASVIVNVANVAHKDQSSPEFSPQKVSTALKENRDKNEPIYIFSAKDASRDNVIYRIVAGNDQGEFHLDEKTGELWATNNFNYNVQPSYTITVEADRVPDLKDPLPQNFVRLEISESDFHGRPVFEKQQYTVTILNTLPHGSPILKVTAKDKDLLSNEVLIYSLVNYSGAEFDIDKHTGQIVVGSVTGKAGIFNFNVQATDPYGVSDQTAVQVMVECADHSQKCPDSSNDIVEIKINQTVKEVESHIPKIIRLLGDMLKQNVTLDNIASDSNNKHDTDIEFHAVGKSKQELVRSLTDRIQDIQQILNSEFGEPVDVTVLEPPKFLVTPEEIAGIVLGTLFAIILVSAAFVLKSNMSQSTSEPTENTDVESGPGVPTSGVPAEGNGQTESSEKKDLVGGNGGSATGAQDKDTKQTESSEKKDSEGGNGESTTGAQDKDKKQNEFSEKKDSEGGNGESTTGAQDKDKKETEFPKRDSEDGNVETAPSAQDKDNKQTEFSEKKDSEGGNGGSATSAQDRDTKDKSQSTSESTEKTDVESGPGVPTSGVPAGGNGDKSQSTSESTEKTDVESGPGVPTSGVPAGGNGDMSQSTSEPTLEINVQSPPEVPTCGDPAEDNKQTESPEKKGSEGANGGPVTSIQDKDNTETEPNGLQLDKATPDKEPVNGQKPEITQETEVDYVETWESYESDDDSDMESTNKDGTKQEISGTTAIQEDTEQPQSTEGEKVTHNVTFLDDE
ncbi:protocadherin Fat 4-like isoform X2 [Pseudophryne corroboree]|uniref:protocadherin Fat 4-like isoform X2 n=1 Tax=Pseudophryne corroboree TaxID=495146 RepID=UPI003081AF96